jgi:hypothetical protein
MCGVEKKAKEVAVRLRYVTTGKYPEIGFTLPWTIIDKSSFEKKVGDYYFVEVTKEGYIIFKPIKRDDS